MRVRGRRFVFLVVLALVVANGRAPAAQTAADVDPAIREALAQGRALFENVQQVEAIAQFTEILEWLGPAAESGEMTDGERAAFFDSLSLRTRAAFNLGLNDVVNGGLDTAIRLDPGFECGVSLVSPPLAERCIALRSQLVGLLELRVLPPEAGDAEVEIDGRIVDLGRGSVPIAAGSHLLSVNRPGYAGHSASVEVSAGTDVPTLYEVTLERVSAVLRVITRPPGATLHVDTVEHGPTVGSASFDPTRSRIIDGYPRREYSADLIVPNLSPGVVTIVVTMDGYRTVRQELTLARAADYATEFALERAQGTVVMPGLPEGAIVEANRRGGPLASSGPPPISVNEERVTLPVGVYDLVVTHPVAGYFERALTIVDREEYSVDVRLRPTVALLGVLGGDDVGARLLVRELTEVFGALEEWTFQNETEAGMALVAGAGLDADTLRGLVNPFSARVDLIDWAGVQVAADRDVSSAVYVLGVLDNDLSASYADLWIWRSAPGTSLPARLRVSLTTGDAAGVASIVRQGFAEIPVVRPWLGALLIDTAAESGPFVADVTDGGPAQTAGLQVGDVILSVNGVSVTQAAEVNAAVVSSAASASVTIAFTRAGGAQEVALTPAAGPFVVALRDQSIAYPVASARLFSTLDRAAYGQPAWVWELNDAATLLEAGDLDGALDVLRQIERIPSGGPGVGRAAVQYWLGLAYLQAGPRFSGQARRSFEQAAQDPAARLWHNDGPWVAPRARARLAQLDGSGRTAP